MKTRILLPLALFFAAILGAGAALTAAPPADPVIRADERSDLELDLALIRADLLPLVLETARIKDEQWARQLEMILGLAGVDALDRVRIETNRSREATRSRITVTLDSAVDGGLLGALFSVPDGSCSFARYVRKADLRIFGTMENLPANLEALLALAASPEIRRLAPMLPFDADGELVIGEINPRRDLLPLLAGEIDIMQLEAGGDRTMPLVVTIAAYDGFALRDRLLEAAGQLGGPEMAMMAGMLRSLPAEDVGGFEFTVLPMGPALAVSKDFLVVGTVPESLREMLERPRGDLEVPDGRTWLRIEGEALATYLAGQAGALLDDEGGALLTELQQALASGPLTRLEVRTTCRPGRLVVESQLDGSALSAGFGLLHAFLADAPRLLAVKMAQEEEAALQRDKMDSLVRGIDQAMTLYGVEHGGLFPADPHELVDGGYLDVFPDLIPTPAGEYLEDGYTYIPLLDAEGQIAGYYLFLYGPDPYGINDVFTAENLADLGHFVIGADGQPDGVGAFCYDGLALDQVERWRDR